MFKLDHVGVTTFNEAATLEFYEMLGFRPVEECNIFLEENHIILMENDRGSKIEIAAYQPNSLSVARKALTNEGFNHYAFTTADFEGACERLKSWGVSISLVQKDHTGREYFFFKDPNGIKFEVINEVVGG